MTLHPGGARAPGLRALVAHLSSPKPGERQNGDAVLVREDEAQRTLIAVIDGLGHGPDAAHASRLAIAELEKQPLETPVHDLMIAVHHALRGSRGAAATVGVIRGIQLEICAVGNVQLLCTQCQVPLVLSAGVLGHQVAKYRVATADLRAGARIALLSDGIATRFRLEELRHLDPVESCRFVMSRFRRKEDDATILVADLLA